MLETRKLGAIDAAVQEYRVEWIDRVLGLLCSQLHGEWIEYGMNSRSGRSSELR